MAALPRPREDRGGLPRPRPPRPPRFPGIAAGFLSPEAVESSESLPVPPSAAGFTGAGFFFAGGGFFFTGAGESSESDWIAREGFVLRGLPLFFTGDAASGFSVEYKTTFHENQHFIT